MGLPTAKQVASAGHDVRGYDVRPLSAESTVGLTMCQTPRDAAEGCDLLCVSVFSDEQVEGLLIGDDGLFAVLRPGAVVAIFTTGTIESAQELAASAPNGVAVLDTCFSRAESNASSLLNLLVGGEREALDRCRGVFDIFCKEIFYLGPSGAGRALKLVNNLLHVANNQIIRDALNFAEKLGFDRYEAAKIIDKCTGASRATSTYTKPYDEIVKYMRPTAVKDATAAVAAARRVGADLGPLGVLVSGYVEEHVPQGRPSSAAPGT